MKEHREQSEIRVLETWLSNVQALHETVRLWSNNTTLAFDVKAAYPALTEEVVRIDMYSSRALAFLFAGFNENMQVYLPNTKDSKKAAKLFTEIFSLNDQDPSLNFVEPDNFLSKSIYDFITKKQLNATEEIARAFVKEFVLFGYSSEVRNTVFRVLENFGVKHEDIKKAYNDLGIDTDALDVSNESSPNSKIYFRKSLDEFEERSVFNESFNLNWTSADSLLGAFKEGYVPEFLLYKKQVFVKESNLASGAGVHNFRLGSNEDLEEFKNFIFKLEQENKNLSQIIVEEGAELGEDSFEGSAQFFVDFDGQVSFLGLTKQIIKDKEHQGNIISYDRDFFESNISDEQIRVFGDFVKYLSDKSGYRGYMSLDFIVDKNGVPKLLEANARITGATASLALCAALQITNPKSKVYLASINTVELDPERKLSFDELLVVLKKEGLLFDFEKGRGLVPSLIALPEKIGFIAIDMSDEENKEESVKKLLETVKSKLPLKPGKKEEPEL